MAIATANVNAVDTSTFDTDQFPPGSGVSFTDTELVFRSTDGNLATISGSFEQDGFTFVGNITGYLKENEIEITGLVYDVDEWFTDLIDGNGTKIARTFFALKDSITGSIRRDTLFGYNGADTISGRGGNDIINGGFGNDRLFGNNGNDVLSGLGNNDVLAGNSGKDTLNGGDGNDRLNGGGGNDRLFGAAGADLLDGSLNNDFLNGGLQKDTLIGGRGNDDLRGGAGIDFLNGTRNGQDGVGERDRLTGGGGADRFILGSGTRSFYLDSGLGGTSFARILDFESQDRLIVSGSRSNYRLAQSQGDTFLLRLEPGADDTIARIDNTTGLNLNSSQFIYI